MPSSEEKDSKMFLHDTLLAAAQALRDRLGKEAIEAKLVAVAGMLSPLSYIK